ncbi:hypothetical protein EJ03DRAFT_218747 [Teratosphaeria nubilosa]|uniref:Uncharacterized protein n=1 Tax=Teratosphaeria nubilosa TaxID=161662 RepID=A0A6G1KYP9_9PEZI|nr:hypothetical protein EJ03DRAFT_218747 [Teratosphaeria nubilosa]
MWRWSLQVYDRSTHIAVECSKAGASAKTDKLRAGNSRLNFPMARRKYSACTAAWSTDASTSCKERFKPKPRRNMDQVHRWHRRAERGRLSRSQLNDRAKLWW